MQLLQVLSLLLRLGMEKPQRGLRIHWLARQGGPLIRIAAPAVAGTKERSELWIARPVRLQRVQAVDGLCHGGIPRQVPQHVYRALAALPLRGQSLLGSCKLRVPAALGAGVATLLRKPCLEELDHVGAAPQLVAGAHHAALLLLTNALALLLRAAHVVSDGLKMRAELHQALQLLHVLRTQPTFGIQVGRVMRLAQVQRSLRCGVLYDYDMLLQPHLRELRSVLPHEAVQEPARRLGQEAVRLPRGKVGVAAAVFGPLEGPWQVHTEERGHEDNARVAVHGRRASESPAAAGTDVLQAVLLEAVETLELMELVEDNTAPVKHLEKREGELVP
mmetsp:Transcript_95822/g.286037  ORF Transcript_95822/g.286037 Transcript_95822/m.286037 type:complete len:333 (+) Transcript_95822:858-1856(+)